MTVDVNIRPYDEEEIQDAVRMMEENPINADMNISTLELRTNPFEWRVETKNAEEFFTEISGASIQLEPETGIGSGGEVGELELDADEEAYEHINTIVDVLEDQGYEVPSIRFSDGMSIRRIGKIGGGTAPDDVPEYIENFEDGKHEIVIRAEKHGEGTAVKYNTDGYAVIEKGQLIHPERKEFLKPDRELGFELSEELRETDIPIEWRTGARQSIDYTDERVEYEDGKVSQEGEPSPLPTSVTGGNDYEKGLRSYEVDGEEYTGTVLEPRPQEKSYLQRLRELV